MNDLYEFGGSCDVIIRCNSERTIGGKTYQANEPYTILEDVFVNLQYANINSESSAKTNIIASREGYPSIINISGLTFTTKISDLIATRDKRQYIGQYYRTTAKNGIIYLPCTILPGDIYIYDNKHNRLVNFTLHEDGDKLIGEFIDDVCYLIFYQIAVNSPSFDLSCPHYGYFTLEIFSKGNTDKMTQNLYMCFPACSLLSTAGFDFINGNILNTPLQFQCIYKNQPNPYFNVGV